MLLDYYKYMYMYITQHECTAKSKSKLQKKFFTPDGSNCVMVLPFACLFVRLSEHLYVDKSCQDNNSTTLPDDLWTATKT